MAEFGRNNRVAFTTIPPDPMAVQHIRVQNALVQKSARPESELRAFFTAHLPGWADIPEAMRAGLVFFEILVQEVRVILDYDKTVTATF